MFKVLILDDHRLFCDGLEKLLLESGQFTVIGKYHDPQSLLADLPSLDPNIITIDIELPGMNGLELIPRIKLLNNNPKIVVLSIHTENVYIRESIKAGASGYFSKNTESRIFIDSLFQIMMGGKAFEDTHHRIKEIKILSNQELKILTLISQGKTSEEIAQPLQISINTVKTHRRHMLKKLKAENTAELLKLAFQNGLL